jgi:hypothetical protein
MDHNPSSPTRDPDSVHDLVAEATRELALRRAVYPGLVARGKLKQAEAQRRIDLMDAIVRRLTRTAGL